MMPNSALIEIRNATLYRGNTCEFEQLNEIPPDIDRVILVRQGTIVADGPKDQVLNTENLMATFDTPLRLKLIDGFYFAYPAS